MEWLNPSSFDWDNAPLNKSWQAAGAVSLYLVVINLLEQKALRKPFPSWVLDFIKKWQIVHNLTLSLASLVMVVATAVTVVKYKLNFFPNDPDTGTEFLTCTTSPGAASGRLFYWVYLFYLSKYLELLDTMLQMAKGKRPPSYYFHVWHHSMYLMICWGYCKYRSSLSILAVVINGSVHIVMYYYYHLSVRGIQPWWKYLITKMQIVQFIAGYGFFSMNVKRQYFDRKPCNGQVVLILHALFNLTMLIGFIRILARIKAATAAEASLNDAVLVANPARAKKKL